MKTVWTSHLKGDEAKQFEKLIRNCLVPAIVDRLYTILDNDLERLELDTQSARQYDKPAWGEYTAHCNGYKEAMRLIKELFDLGEAK
jgi:hypothetical protein